MRKAFLLFTIALFCVNLLAEERSRTSFNGNWLLAIGDMDGAQSASFDDQGWEQVTLPHAWNEQEAFRIACAQLSDTIVWYRKHFTVDETESRKFFIEFEGARFAADVYLNGHLLGISENGVMAFGFDMTPYIKKGENVLAVRTDNSWNYHERSTGSPYQWNNKNFNANYGGLPKNVWLHTTGLLHQTLPLYSNLGTTGTYVYGSDYDVPQRSVVVNVESEVKNDDAVPHTCLLVQVLDA